MLKEFLHNRIQDLTLSITTKPRSSDITFSLVVTLIYAVVALSTGFLTGFLTIRIVEIRTLTMATLPFSLFVMPSLIEELFFRALMLPHKTRKCGVPKQVFLSLFSIFVFIAWHPVNAITINPGAYTVFTDPVFLILATLMAVACTITYLKSGSVWVPVFIHWLTVLVWVFF
jgi:predicted Abi (CAAX) family protease